MSQCPTVCARPRRETDARVNEGLTFGRNGQTLIGLLVAGLTAGLLVGMMFTGGWNRGGDEDDGDAVDQLYPPFLDKGFPSDARPTEKQKMWALATCGVLAELNGHNHHVLGGKLRSETTPARLKEEKDMLERMWGIVDKETLMEALSGLASGGHRESYDELVHVYAALPPDDQVRMQQMVFARGGDSSNKLDVVLATRERFKDTSLAGWDFTRYVFLCGDGNKMGYITEEEAWQLIMPAARLLQKTFSSWNDLYDNYIEGRRFWSLRTYQRGGKEKALEAAYDLKWDRVSPLRRLRWDLNLGPEEQKDDGSKEYQQVRATYFGTVGKYYNKTKEELAEAVRLLTVAVEKGSVDAMYLLALCNQWGIGGLRSDEGPAIALYKKAAELGDASAMIELARIALWKKDGKQTIEWARKAVDAGGGTIAEHWLGLGYTTEKQFAEAFKWHEKAAKGGEPEAQYYCGKYLLNGEGVEKDVASAVAWFRLSAENGDNDGMFYLAQCLEHGTGVAKNMDEAMRWYKRSADKNHPDAKKRLEAK